MSRRRKPEERKLNPDALFESQLVTKLINMIMKNGKRSVAEKIVYLALQTVLDHLKKNEVVIQSSGYGNTSERERGKFDNNKEQVTLSARSMSGDVFTDAKAREVVLKALQSATANTTPMAEVRSRRVGGSNYQVPVEVSVKRRLQLALRWLIEAARKRNEKTMKARLGREIIEALQGMGAACKKREETHRMAKANLAFAHYRWQ